MTHTATPWFLNGFDIAAADHKNGHQVTICKISGNMDCNAAFIVRACNAHDDLVKALEDIIYDCESDYPPSYGAIKQAAKQALAKASHE